MAVWLVGGAVAFVVYIDKYDVYSDHGDYSNYSDYSNHSDYSDAAERKRRRIAALEEECKSAVQSLEGYKRDSVNPKLLKTSLKQEPAMTVSETDMDKDAKKKIDQEMQQQVRWDTADVEAQLEEVNRLLERIYQIEKEADS
ncbi:MAG: hypothetical protein HFH28_07305 [Clostridiaceae bacterium]|jgi:hypothetical protein|nr:hypothetical protein [Clostridiaceae bacterium]